MELVAEKYKQTEAGLIPRDWVLKTIGDICQIFGRIGFRGYTVNDIVGKDQGAITISPSNIQDDKMDFSKCTYISWFKYEESPEIKIFNGDILLVKTGSTYGKTAIIKDLKEKATINPQIVVLKKITVDNFFLGYVMSHEVVQNQIKTTIVGGAIPTLSQKQVSSFKIPIPPTKSEQTAIATALSDADALINSLEKLIAKKRKIKQGAMQHLLKPKEGWEVKKLGDLFKLSASNSKSGYLTDEGKYIVMDMGAVSSEGTILKSKRTNLNSDILNYGDLVMPKDDIGGGNIIGKVGYIDKTDSYVLGDHVYKLELITSKIDSLYFYFLINSVYINKHFRAKASGSAQLGLGRKSVLEQELIYPCTKEEQTRIATILSDMDAEISALESKLEKYRKVKLGMMQNLLTGKIRLV